MSDRTGRRPLGTLTRHPADWFSDFFYSLGQQTTGSAPPGDNQWTAFGFYNNDDTGRVMKVYGVSVGNNGGGGMGFFFQAGTIGAFVSNATAIRPDRAAPTGQVYSETQFLPFIDPSPFSFGTQFGLIGTSGFDGNTVVSPFPLFIIPAGFSLIATPVDGGGNQACFIWYQLAAQ